ncbi:MAG: ABC transporter substrate-binding protein [Firmicutes bacterium]|nr:ABC transporter substrate-binding protein [Bacillota bacterium]
MKKCLLFLVMVLLLTGCGKNDNDLVMVTEAGFPPYEFYENGKVVGVDIEIANEIAKELNKNLVIKDIAFDSIINELKSGKADFAAAGMSITEDRLKEADFTIEYIVSEQVVVVRNDSQINNIDDIKEKTISVQLGTVADQYVTKNYKEAKVNRLKKFLVAAEDVKNNKSDCIVMDKLPALELVKKNPELKILDGTLFEDKYGMAVKKGNKELLDQINKVLERLINEGKIEEYTVKFSE